MTILSYVSIIAIRERIVDADVIKVLFYEWSYDLYEFTE